MNNLLRRFVADAYNRHIFAGHNADFEVCRYWRCRLARWLEVRLNLWGWE